MKEIDIPLNPSTEELIEQHPLNMEAELSIANERIATNAALNNHEDTLFAVIGYCARPNVREQQTILAEGRAVAALETMGRGIQTSHRGPWHKPRTNPERDWQGEEQTDPEGVHASVHDEAIQIGQVSGEVRCKEHLLRYAHMLKWAWTGGRNEDDFALMRAIARHDPTLGVGVKNGLSGAIDTALQHVDRINTMREGYEDPASAVLVYRGGENAKNPLAWRNAYLDAHEQTSGLVIVDIAHGTEMAHDPDGQFKKTVAGQILAMEAVLDLAREGYAPAGIMIEASDLKSRTDPHMPLEIALNGVKQLYNIKTGSKKAIML